MERDDILTAGNVYQADIVALPCLRKDWLYPA